MVLRGSLLHAGLLVAPLVLAGRDWPLPFVVLAATCSARTLEPLGVK